MKTIIARWLRALAQWLDPIPRMREYTIRVKPGFTAKDLVEHLPPGTPFRMSLGGKVMFESTLKKP